MFRRTDELAMPRRIVTCALVGDTTIGVVEGELGTGKTRLPGLRLYMEALERLNPQMWEWAMALEERQRMTLLRS